MAHSTGFNFRNMRIKIRITVGVFILSFLNIAHGQGISVANLEQQFKKHELYHETETHKAIKLYTNWCQESEKIGYKRGMAYCHYKLSESYSVLWETDQVILHAEKSEQIAREINDYFILSNAISLRAFAVGSVKSYDISKAILKESMVYAKKIPDNDKRHITIGMLYFSMASIYSYDTKIQIDSALYYNNKSLQVYQKLAPGFIRNRDVGAAYVAIGENYLYKKQYDKAEAYIKKGLELPKPKGYGFYDVYGYQALGSIYRAKKEYPLSVEYYKKAIAQAKEYKNAWSLKDLYLELSNAYIDINENDSSKISLSRYSQLHDSLDLAERMRVDKTTKVILENQTAAMEKTKVRLYIVIAFAVILLLALAYFSNELYKRYLKEKNEKKEQEASLLDKKTKLNVMSLRVSTSYDEIIVLAKNGDPKFATLFKELYPEFYDKLMHLQPNLTLIEQKFCFFLKLKFSTKEIAEYTYVTPKAIQNRKNRIRKRLGIADNEDIYQWIENL